MFNENNKCVTGLVLHGASLFGGFHGKGGLHHYTLLISLQIISIDLALYVNIIFNILSQFINF